jgi:hypothetical protein
VVPSFHPGCVIMLPTFREHNLQIVESTLSTMVTKLYEKIRSMSFAGKVIHSQKQPYFSATTCLLGPATCLCDADGTSFVRDAR